MERLNGGNLKTLAYKVTYVRDGVCSGDTETPEGFNGKGDKGNACRLTHRTVCSKILQKSRISAGDQQDLVAALTIIEVKGPPRGLFLNRGKSFILAPANNTIIFLTMNFDLYTHARRNRGRKSCARGEKY